MRGVVPATFLLLSFALLFPQALAAPRHAAQGQEHRGTQSGAAAAAWRQALQEAITDIQRQGAGRYSTGDDAHNALHAAFAWDKRSQRLTFRAAGARPSFCSGAVYAALLSALIRWDAAQPRRCLSASAWQALAPRRVPDGCGPWGWANANGPGMAMLVHTLGAGHSFTEWEKAQPFDIVKIWWNDTPGARERGHIAFLMKDEGETVRVWSSNLPGKNRASGFGFRTYRKKSIRRVLFTRITNPAAFNNAPGIGDNTWLMQLMRQPTSWSECLKRSGVSK